jgi:exodeoxyribonuclease VII large subunit
MPGEQGLARVYTPPPSEILSVSALTHSVRDLLERRYPLLWVSGEISNFILANSGHAYFVLKDPRAQVRCVMFKHRYQLLQWQPTEGAKVEVQALLTLYEPRGDFQLTIEGMRRSGLGALFEAFTKLKEKLDREGLFSPERKKPLPPLPRAVGVITSRDAAALRDVLTTMKRRNPSVTVVLYPASVQGRGAAEEIANALAVAGIRRECDVLLLVRGGGSIEDLWAFNEEIVARAICGSPIPVVAGVGHETDFTIADFAADRRAPTPTAAAELVSPERTLLLDTIMKLTLNLGARVCRTLEDRMLRVDHLSRRLLHPEARLLAQAELLRQLRTRLSNAIVRILSEREWRIAGLVQRGARLPGVQELASTYARGVARLRSATQMRIDRCAADLAKLEASLAHLDPAAVLGRGYSIALKMDGSIVRDSAILIEGESVALRFSRGQARARIIAKE